jgi:hypothetical protein
MSLEEVHLALPPDLVAYAKKMAYVRHKPHYDSHAQDMQGEDWVYEFIGALTEVAFCWWAGLMPPKVDQREGDGGVDAVLEDGRKVQIKGTARPDMNLLVPCRNYNDMKICDVIVMGGVPKGMRVEEGAVDLVGWTTSVEFYAESVLTADRFARKMYRFNRKLLKPMRDLL